MSQSFTVCCPHCQASGELDDLSLMGKSIICPVCQKVFVAPAPATKADAPVVNVSDSILTAPITQPASPSVPSANPVLAAPESRFPPATPGGFPSAPAYSVPSPFPPTEAAPPFPAPATTTNETGFFSGRSSPLPEARQPEKTVSRPQIRKAGNSKMWGLVAACTMTAILLLSIGVYFSDVVPRGSKRPLPSATVASAKKRNSKLPSKEKTEPVKPAMTIAEGKSLPDAFSDAKVKAANKTKSQPIPARTSVAIAETAKPTMPAPATPSPVPAPETVQTIPAEILAKLKSATNDQSREILIQYLSHAHAGVRQQAAEILFRLAPAPSATPPLLKLLSDSVPQVRQAAAVALGKHGIESPEVVTNLGKLLLEDPDPNVRADAIRGLRAIGSGPQERARAVADVLLSALNKPKSPEQEYLVEAFTVLGDAAQPALPVLAKMFGHSDCDVTIAGILAQYGQFDVISPTVAEKGIAVTSKKISIAKGLGRMRPMSPAALNVLKVLYEDPDSQLREATIGALWDCEPKFHAAMALLEQAQNDVDRRVREYAARTISVYQLDPTRNTDALLQQLAKADSNALKVSEITQTILKTKKEGFRSVVTLLVNREIEPEIRTAAAKVLAMSWTSDAYDIGKKWDLKKLLNVQDQPQNIRTSCAIALARLNEKDAVITATLLSAVADKSLDLSLRTQAAHAVPRDDPQVVTVLAAVAATCEEPLPTETAPEFRTGHVEFHGAVLKALGQLQSIKPDMAVILPRLVTAVQQADVPVKQIALEGLKNYGGGSPEAIGAIREFMKHESAAVRVEAVKTIGILHSVATSAIPDLQVALKDEQMEVAQEAARALGHFGPAAAESVPELIAVLSDSKKCVTAAAEALVKIAPQNEAILPPIIAALSLPDARIGALDALQEIGPAAGPAVPELRKILPDSEKSLRVKILNIFAGLGAASKDALPELVQQLSDKEASIRAAACSALGSIKGLAASAVPELIKQLADPNEEVLQQALKALKRIGGPANSAIPTLENLMSTSPPHIATLIQETLDRLKAAPGTADPVLFESLLDDDNWERASKQPLAENEFSKLMPLAIHENAIVRSRTWMWLQSLSENVTTRAAFLKLLNGDNSEHRALAAIALNQLPEQGDTLAFANAIIPWTGTEPTRKTAISLLARLGPSAAPAVLTGLTNDKASFTKRLDLIDGLTKHRDWESTALQALLRPLLKSEDASQRQLSAFAFARLNPREAELLSHLVGCLDQQDLQIRRLAVFAITSLAAAEVDVSSARPALQKMLMAHTFTQAPPNGDDKDEFLGICQTLSTFVIPPEELPSLRELLHRLTETATMTMNSPSEQVARAKAACGLMNVISTTGTVKTEAIPELKAFLELGLDDGTEELELIYAKAVGRFAPAITSQLLEIAAKSEGRIQARLLAFKLLKRIAPDDVKVAALFQGSLQDANPVIKLKATTVLVDNPATHEMVIPVARELLRDFVTATTKFPQVTDLIASLGRLKSHAQAAVPELLGIAKQDGIEPQFRIESALALVNIAPESLDVQTTFVDLLLSQPQEFAVAMVLQAPDSAKAGLVAALTQVLEKDAGPTRIRAAYLLGHQEALAASSIPTLRALLISDSGAEGLAAAIAIARIVPSAKDTVARIFNAFVHEKDPDGLAASTLKRLGPTAGEILPQLLELAKDAQREPVVIQIIGTFGPAAKPALDFLKERLNGPHRDLTLEAIQKLGSNAGELAPLLIQMLPTTDNPVRVAQALAAMGEPGQATVDQLRQQLLNPAQRLISIQLLEIFGTRAAAVAPEVLNFAKGEEIELRLAAIRTLAAIAPTESETLSVLSGALSDPNPWVAEAAGSGLSILGEKALPALPQMIVALETRRRVIQRPLINVLKNIGPAAQSAVPILTQLCEDSDLDVRNDAKNALEKIVQPPAKTP